MRLFILYICIRKQSTNFEKKRIFDLLQKNAKNFFANIQNLSIFHNIINYQHHNEYLNLKITNLINFWKYCTFYKEKNFNISIFFPHN